MVDDREKDPSSAKQDFAKKNAIYFAIAGSLFIVAGVWENPNVALLAIGAVNMVMSAIFWRRSRQ